MSNGRVYVASAQGAVDTTKTIIDEKNNAIAIANSHGNAPVDFNGDGYEDLAASAPEEDVNDQTDAGLVNIIYGSATGLNGSTVPGQRFFQDYSIKGVTSSNIRDFSEAEDKFGSALTPGDFNNDGYSDLAASAPLEDLGSIVDAGAVNIIYGSSEGLSPDAVVINQFRTAHTLETGNQFGTALVLGDFDGDGYDDMAVGAPYDTINGEAQAGSVEVFYGSASGLLVGSGQRFFQDYSSTEGSNLRGLSESGDNFGVALASADYNGDGYFDLALGIPGKDENGREDTGAVSIIYGSADGLSIDFLPDQLWVYTPDESQYALNDNHFGRVLTSADFNNDGYADLGSGTDRVSFAYGSAAGLVIPGSGEGVRVLFDRIDSMAAGDFDNDGDTDLVAGLADGLSVSAACTAGLVRVLPGSSSGFEELPITISGFCLVSGFGWSMTSGDYNKDGFLDLVVGAPNYNTVPCSGGVPGFFCGDFVGAVSVHYGSESNLGEQREVLTQDSAGIEDRADNGDRFGASLT